jgi:hypothetical protein
MQPLILELQNFDYCFHKRPLVRNICYGSDLRPFFVPSLRILIYRSFNVTILLSIFINFIEEVFPLVSETLT